MLQWAIKARNSGFLRVKIIWNIWEIKVELRASLKNNELNKWQNFEGKNQG